MITAERVIAQAIRYTNRPSAEARSIVVALRDAGYEIVSSRRSCLTETERVFSE